MHGHMQTPGLCVYSRLLSADCSVWSWRGCGGIWAASGSIKPAFISSHIPASLLPLLEPLHFQSLFVITCLLFSPGDGCLPPRPALGPSALQNSAFVHTHMVCIHVPFMLLSTPFAKGGPEELLPPPCSAPSSQCFGVEGDMH